MRRTLYINGKFTAQRVTGVQRAAAGLLQALDEALGRRDAAVRPRCVLLCPRPGSLPLTRNVEARAVGTDRWGLHIWEQAMLPWSARNGVLVNLAGAAPWWAREQVCVLHDAAVFDHPEAYTRLFVAWYRRLFVHLARSAAAVITVSDFSKQRLMACLDLKADQITVLPLGADHLGNVAPDHSIMERLNLNRASFMLAVGSANPTKNFATLVTAFAQVQSHGSLKLVIVGGANAAVFAPAVEVPELAGSVIHAGVIDDSQLKALYENALALVFPSLYEGFGLPALEAMACGCPVAASRAGAIPEACGDAALYFDPLDASDLARALTSLAADQSLQAHLRRAGHERAAHYSWRASGEALLNRLQPLLIERIA